MLYLSELIGMPVIAPDGNPIGSLSDLVFVTSTVPYITKLQLKAKQEHVLYSVAAIKYIDSQIQLQTSTPVTLGENEAFAVQNLLDQQIIDIKGRNIVRVNDVVIQDKPELVISGIDIGIPGILRWFGLEKILAKLMQRPLKQQVLPWTEIQLLELARGKIVLNIEEDKLKSIAPEDLADYLEKTTIHNALKILNLVNDQTASEVIANLHIHYQTQIFRQMPIESAVQIVTHADPDEAVDLLLTVSTDKREKILSHVPVEKKKELTFLLSHAHTDIGEQMTTEFLTFAPEETVNHVLDRIKKESRGFENLPYGYVLNKEHELIGVFSLHELLLQDRDTEVVKFMRQNVVAIHVTTPKQVALKRMRKYTLRALPVIDKQRTMVGLVTFDDIVEPYLSEVTIQ